MKCKKANMATKSYVLHTILIVTLLISLTGCRQGNTDYENMTDKEKLEVLDFKIEHHPKDAALLNERAGVLLNLGRVKEAAVDIDNAVDLEPKNVDYRLRQADVWFADGNVEKSYKALTEAEKLAPESLEVLLKMGEVTFYSRDYDRSLKTLSRVTEKEPDNRTALFMKGFIYKEQGDTANAVVLLRRVCDLHPDYAPAYEELGVLYATRANPLAVEYLNTAIQLDPSNTNSLYALAMYYQERGEMDAAESLYHNILDINEHSADAWHNLGYIELTHYHDYQRALEYFDKALEIDPAMEQAQHNRQLAQQLVNEH